MNLLLRFLAVAGLCAATHVFAADTFEGKVSLAMTAAKGKAQTLNYSIKKQAMRIDMNAEGHQITTIMDLTKLEMLILMSEQRMYMVMPIKSTVEAAKAKTEKIESHTEIERTGKTEKILGYTCDQILVKDTEKGTVTELWIAPDLGMFMGMGSQGGGGPFGGRKGPGAAKWEEAIKGKGGFPLRVITRDTGGKETFKMEATKIEPGSLPDSDFLPPADYQKFQMPDLGGLNPFKRG